VLSGMYPRRIPTVMNRKGFSLTTDKIHKDYFNRLQGKAETGKRKQTAL
jgi:hypothetical protein